MGPVGTDLDTRDNKCINPNDSEFELKRFLHCSIWLIAFADAYKKNESTKEFLGLHKTTGIGSVVGLGR